jgi:hypothetical protein
MAVSAANLDFEFLEPVGLLIQHTPMGVVFRV